MSGGKPGTNPKGGIIGSDGAFGALAGAGAAAAFSFLTLEAGFLGMVPWTRWRRRTWVGGRECRFDGLAAFASVRRRTAGAGAQKGDARSVNELALHPTHARRARVVLGCPLSLCGPGPSWLEFTVFD